MEQIKFEEWSKLNQKEKNTFIFHQIKEIGDRIKSLEERLGVYYIRKES